MHILFSVAETNCVGISHVFVILLFHYYCVQQWGFFNLVAVILFLNSLLVICVRYIKNVA